MLGTMGLLPFGGHVWVHLNWLRGFHGLGHEVWYVEDHGSWPYNPDQNAYTDDCGYALRQIPSWLSEIGLDRRWAFRHPGTKRSCSGMLTEQLAELYKSCDILINMAGATELNDEQLVAPLRVLLHTDPGAAEIQIANGDPFTTTMFERHHFIITCAENYLGTDCRIPLNGLDSKYRSIRQAVDLELWNSKVNPTAKFFTTVGNYKQTGNDVDYQGETYLWSKHHEWEKFADLPRRTPQPFQVALGVASEDRRRLESLSWNIVPPLPMSYDIFGAYRNFIFSSRAEWTVAKDQYVRLRSGWFSDRDATYLASGKPVIAQATGFEKHIPTGRGLFHFHTMDDILSAIDAINSNYLAHCKAAREIAVQYFDANKMAASFVDKVGTA
jgi:hypothetical protein